MVWIISRDPEVVKFGHSFLDALTYLCKDGRSTNLVTHLHIFFVADQTIDFDLELMALGKMIDMILDHHYAELGENQIALQPELVRCSAFLVQLIHFDELVAPIVHEAEIEYDLDTHVQNSLAEAKLFDHVGQVPSFKESRRERYFDWREHVHVRILPIFADDMLRHIELGGASVALTQLFAQEGKNVLVGTLIKSPQLIQVVSHGL